MGPPFFTGAGANPIWSEPELALGPRTSGAAQKSGGSATRTADNSYFEMQSRPSSGFVGIRWDLGFCLLGFIL